MFVSVITAGEIRTFNSPHAVQMQSSSVQWNFPWLLITESFRLLKMLRILTYQLQHAKYYSLFNIALLF